jgi:hypothetical protein
VGGGGCISLYHFGGKYEKRKRRGNNMTIRKKNIYSKIHAPDVNLGFLLEGRIHLLNVKISNMKRLNVEYYPMSKITLVFLYIPF